MNRPERSPTSNHPPTIRDVADSAGVSTATVSNVMRGKQTLYTPDTAHRVWHAVQSLHYRPNHVARSLVRRCTHTLGVVVHHHHGRLTSNSYLSGMLDGFLEFAVSVGYQVKIISLVTDDLEAAVALLEDGSTDGAVLFATPNDSPLLDWAKGTHLPMVAAGSIPPNVDLPCVDVDDKAAIHQAVCWLISQGHRRIGMITGMPTQWSAQRRIEGYRQAMQEAGLAAPSEWMVHGDYTPVGGERGIRTLMQLRSRPTAVVCGNDWTALGALQGLQTLGLCVPGDVSLLGYDDMETARWVLPAITTVRQPLYEIGRTAAELLIRQIEMGRREVTTMLFPGTLIQRQSVASWKEVSGAA